MSGANTGFWGNVINAPYSEMIEKLGEPTRPNGDNDGKVQKEWVFLTEDDMPIAIYDWKEYDIDVTDDSIIEWHIGHIGNQTEAVKQYLAEKGLVVEHEKNIFTVI